MALSIAAGALWGGLGGGLLSGAASAYAADRSGKDAAAATAAQIAWERERATHAHQWEVQDLKAAGLNPTLSAGGSGATTGGISAPMPDRSGYAGAGAAFIDAINTAYSAAKLNADIGKTGAETNNITQDTKNKLAQQELIQKQAINEALRSGLISAQTANTEFKNLTEKFNGERASLTYWNEFVNKASSSAKNVADIGFNAVDHLLPKRYTKEALETMGKGWKHVKTSYKH